MSKIVTVEIEWRSTHRIEVPDDFTSPRTFDGFPPDVLEQLTPQNAEPFDWDVR